MAGVSDTGGSFQVDPTALGQLPSYLREAGDALAGLDVAFGHAASATGSSAGGQVVSGFGVAFDALVRSGAAALASDVAKIDESAERYRRNEDGVSASFSRSGDRR